MTSRHAEAGFTLVEVLVALALLALVMAAATGAFRLTGAAVEAAGRRSEVAGEVALMRDVIRRQVARALPLTGPVDPETGAARSLFQGTGTTLSFVVAEPPGPGGGLVRVAFTVEPGTGGRRRLTWHRSPLAGGPDHTATVAEGPFDLAFAYLGSDGWTARWQDAAAPPRLVRLSIAVAGVAQPELLAAPRADAERGCVLALGEGFCRDWPAGAAP
jgi:general secretion pathway protein J